MPALIALLLLWPLPALANQPPGPVPALSLLSLLLLLPILTALAGGYAVLRPAGRAPSRWRIPVAIAATLFAAAHEGNALLVTAALALAGFARGVQLCWYAWRVRRGTLPGGSVARLLGGGLALAVLSPLALVTALAFFGFWPMESYALDRLQRDLALTLAAAEARPDAEGRPTFQAPTHADGRLTFPDGVVLAADERYFRRTATVAPDGRGLRLDMTPKNFPFPPFHLLTTLPSFRADESGTIRAIRTHEEGARCPPDAPIVHHLTEAERQAGRDALARLAP